MSGCPGLHCPGCSEGQSPGIVAGAALGLVLLDQTVQWVAERIWWIGGTLAVCFALATAASMWLEARADRRGARFAAAHGILSRADVVSQIGNPITSLRPHIAAIGSDSERPALGFRDLHIHLDGMPPADQAQIIRQALNGRNTQS
jgi:hypothetical protein